MSLTRSEYLEKNLTVADTYALHRKYYAQFVGPSEVSYVKQRLGVERLREAFSHDPHLNLIPLKEWDSLGLPGCRNTMKLCGDFPSLANAVCVWKEAAKQALEHEES